MKEYLMKEHSDSMRHPEGLALRPGGLSSGRKSGDESAVGGSVWPDTVAEGQAPERN